MAATATRRPWEPIFGDPLDDVMYATPDVSEDLKTFVETVASNLPLEGKLDCRANLPGFDLHEGRSHVYRAALHLRRSIERFDSAWDSWMRSVFEDLKRTTGFADDVAWACACSAPIEDERAPGNGGLLPGAHSGVNWASRTLQILLERWRWSLQPGLTTLGLMDLVEREGPPITLLPSELDAFQQALSMIEPLAVELRRRTVAAESSAGPNVAADHEITPPSRKAIPATSADLANALKKRHPRARTQILLVEYMEDRRSATFQEIAEHVHDDPETSDEAIRQNVTRTNESLADLQAPGRFRVRSGRVLKKEDPE
jgi:hypothetical protein